MINNTPFHQKPEQRTAAWWYAYTECVPMILVANGFAGVDWDKDLMTKEEFDRRTAESICYV